MAQRMNSVDDFLNHNKRGGGFFNKWRQPLEKKGGGGRAKVWLHPKCLPIALWQHGFPRLVVRENKQTKETERNVWGGTFNCHEDEKVLKNQYKRDEDGNRKFPPKRCPMCKLIERVRLMVDDGELRWTDPIFRFEGDEDLQVIHAGGLYNAFGRDDLDDEEKKELKAAKIKVGGPTGAWRENAQAKMSYLFVIVDNANPGAGAQQATETGLLGDKVKGVISDEMKRWEDSPTPEKGDPFKKPYCIQWEYHPDEQEFQKKYHAVALPMVKLTGEIAKALQAPAPDVSESIAPFNKATMRATLERHCLVKNIPWDEVFDVEEAGEEDEKEADYVDPDAPAGDEDAASDSAESDSGEEADSGSEEPEAEKPKDKKKGAKPAPAPSSAEDLADGDEDDLVECDACHEGIPAELADSGKPHECPHCHQGYDAKGNMVEKKPAAPPGTKKRGRNVGNTKAPF